MVCMVPYVKLQLFMNEEDTFQHNERHETCKNALKLWQWTTGRIRRILNVVRTEVTLDERERAVKFYQEYRERWAGNCKQWSLGLRKASLDMYQKEPFPVITYYHHVFHPTHYSKSKFIRVFLCFLAGWRFWTENIAAWPRLWLWRAFNMRQPMPASSSPFLVQRSFEHPAFVPSCHFH